MDVVAVPVRISKLTEIYPMEYSLFRFLVVRKFEDVDLQRLAVLAHFAEQDSSGLVEIGI